VHEKEKRPSSNFDGHPKFILVGAAANGIGPSYFFTKEICTKRNILARSKPEFFLPLNRNMK
jgi:hypothetical protein